MNVTFQAVENPIKATGYSNQTLGTLSVENNSEEQLMLTAETWQQIAEFLGVSITDCTIEEMPGTLVFLFNGPRNSQFYLTSKVGQIAAGETGTVLLRLKDAPGAAGTFNVHVGESDYQVTVE